MTTTTASLAARRTAVAVLVGATLVLGACATPNASPGSTQPDPGAVVPTTDFPSCADVPALTADPSLYRDEPRYGNATDLTDGVLAWAGRQPGFEQLWLDRDRNGWVHVGFSGDIDTVALQREVEQEFPGEGVVVVAVPYSEAELLALLDEVHESLRDAGVQVSGLSADVSPGVVGLYDVAPVPAAADALRDYAGRPLCVDFLAPESLVPEGEQATAGEGWRLLGHERGVGDAYRTGVATTDEQLTVLWLAAGLPGEPGAVDWEREIVVWFGAVWGSGCPVRLDGVVVDGATLHGEIVVPGWPGMCNADANPHAFVVAVDRALLPTGPFHVQLRAEDPPAGVPEERTVVDVDLSVPGSQVTDDETRPGGPIAEPGLITDGHEGMPENGARYVWHPRPECSGIVIGPIDSSLWRLADGEPEWLEPDGEELHLYPVSADSLVAATSLADYIFLRTDSPTCP